MREPEIKTRQGINRDFLIMSKIIISFGINPRRGGNPASERRRITD